MSSPTLALEARALEKVYPSGQAELRVLQGVDLSVGAGEAVAIVGQSGAGKSTLLHILGALDRPSAGEILVGERFADRTDDQLAELRNRRIGFVFQFHHLLREFTALENVMMPMMIGGEEPRAARARALELLDAVGLSERSHHGPSELSGGEQQRVAVARALANRPDVLLADEPSGNLDRQTSMRLHDLLFRIREEQQLAMVLVTHNPELAGRADRVLTLEDGRIAGANEAGTGATVPIGQGEEPEAGAPDPGTLSTGSVPDFGPGGEGS